MASCQCPFLVQLWNKPWETRPWTLVYDWIPVSATVFAYLGEDEFLIISAKDTGYYVQFAGEEATTGDYLRGYLDWQLGRPR